MDYEFGMSELTDVLIKATQPIVINGQTFETGETLAAFDKIALANFKEVKSMISAKGGYNNLSRVWWEQTKEVKLNFSQGIFSKIQLAFLTNAKVLKKLPNTKLYINERKIIESDENGIVVFPTIPCDPLFIYDIDTGEKITDYEIVDDHTINIGIAYKSILTDYTREYDNGYTELLTGQPLSQGTFVLTAKTKVKEDITGHVKTGIITIPKLKLMSDLSMSLGEQAIPIVGRLDATAYPVGNPGAQWVMSIDFLNDDIDSDM